MPFDLFDWLARVLPGNIITPVIDFLVDLITTFNLGPTDRAAKQIEQFMALVIILIAGILLGVVIAWGIARTSRPGWEIGGGAGPILFLLLAVVESDLSMLNNPVTLLWLALTIVGWGALRRLLSH